jgi:signal transduction histidine kinase
MTPANRIALLATADDELARRLIAEILRLGRACQLPVAHNLAQLRARLSHVSPVAILLDESAVDGPRLEATARRLSEMAPVILLAGAAHEEELSALIVEGNVDFVARTGNFVSLAACLIERRIRWAERPEAAPGQPWMELPAEFSEILRHDINNPLTGILGNAELLLAHRDHLSPLEVQRLETIVDLAVRLRETIRRLSNNGLGDQRRLRAS